MRKLFYLSKTLFDFTSKRQLPLQSIRLLTKADKYRHPKIESELKFLENNTLPSILLNQKVDSVEEWKCIREKLLNLRHITLVNVDTMVMSFCISHKQYDLAYNYLDFLKSTNIQPNISTLGKYFRLFYYSNLNTTVDRTSEDHLIELYDKLRQKYKVFDATTCENVIYGLSLTRNWRDCLKLVDEIKITGNVSSAIYDCIAATSFTNDEDDLGFSLLDTAASDRLALRYTAFLSYLKQTDKLQSVQEVVGRLEKLLGFFSSNYLNVHGVVADAIRTTCEKAEISIQTAKIDNSGVCQQCKQQLQKFHLDDVEFNELKTAVLKNVIIGKDVFRKTTPNELKKFEKFISNMKKYDVVIDGLNVAYSSRAKSSYHMALLVQIMVEHFASSRKKVLLLGRSHMEHWPGWSKITRHADSFLAQSLSQDDPFLLYCALHSGLNTAIVSNDLMRSHVFRLKDPKMKLLFSQWLTQNQLMFQHINHKHRKVIFLPRLPYLKVVQKQGNCWHLPYVKVINENIEEQEEGWLCIRI